MAFWKSNAHGKKDDGVKELDKEDEIKVKDVAELVAEALPDIHRNRKPCRYPRNGKTGPWDRSWESRGSSKTRRRLLPADELFPRAEQHAKPPGPKACCLS